MYYFQQGTSQKCLQLDLLIVIHKMVFSLFILIPETLASDGHKTIVKSVKYVNRL